jgi:hypothetical protein
MTILGMGGISIAAALQANGAANGNGGTITMLSDAGDVDIDGLVNANAGGTQGWGGTVSIEAAGAVRVARQVQANGVLNAPYSIGGVVSLLAGANLVIEANINATPGGAVQVATKNGASSMLTLSSVIDVSSTNAAGLSDGLTHIGPACNLRLSGTLRAARSTPLYDGLNVVEYRGSLDANGVRMFADAEARFYPSAGNVAATASM